MDIAEHIISLERSALDRDKTTQRFGGGTKQRQKKQDESTAH